jgi:hypothetical protein
MSARMNRFCSYHCRSCGSHFTSLAAFDAHKPRNEGKCLWPDKPELIEHTGTCKIADPEQVAKRVTLYEHPDAARARDNFRARLTASP